jgi:uncharacterized protein (DUF169 family)
MRPLKNDLSIYGKFDFERPPVGAKFLFKRPEGIEQLELDKSMAFCERIKEAQQRGAPFYITKDNIEECVGKFLLGMEEMAPFAESGQIGTELKIYQEPRVNSRLYRYIPRFARDTVNYVVYSPIDKLTFEPDVLIITANHRQAEIVMRAMSYSTGELYNSKTTNVMGCAWACIYPHQSGNVNYLVPEMIHGMKARRVFPEGSILISIPYHWIPIMTRNLQEMEWVLPAYTDREKYLAEWERIIGKLIRESENP